MAGVPQKITSAERNSRIRQSIIKQLERHPTRTINQIAKGCGHPISLVNPQVQALLDARRLHIAVPQHGRNGAQYAIGNGAKEGERDHMVAMLFRPLAEAERELQREWNRQERLKQKAAAVNDEQVEQVAA